MKPYIIASGFCRGGTHYLARALQEVGFAVEHEDWGTDGMVSGHLPDLPTFQASATRQSKGRPLLLLHQLRHPQGVISSNLPLMSTGYHAHVLSAVRGWHAATQPGWPLTELSSLGWCVAYWVAQYHRASAALDSIAQSALRTAEHQWKRFRVEDVPRICMGWSWLKMTSAHLDALANIPRNLSTGYQQPGPRGYARQCTQAEAQASVPGELWSQLLTRSAPYYPQWEE